MSRIEVGHLRFRGEPAKAGRVEFAVADALRTEVVDDGRLVLVRSFALGRIRLADRGASRAAAGAWLSIREGARHGGASGAESANCVWFRDLAEARTLLMRELARGRTPFAWFWVLAVPEWRRETLAQWLDRRLSEAARDTSGETAAVLVAEALAADCVEPLAAAILARIPPVRTGISSAEARGPDLSEEGGPAVPEPAPLLYEAANLALEAVALAIARSIPLPLRKVLALVAAQSGIAVFVETLARGLALRAHPALALAPLRLAAVTAAVVRILHLGEAAVLESPAPPRRPPSDAQGAEQVAAREVGRPANDLEAAPRPDPEPARGGPPQASPPAIVEQAPAAFAPIAVELRSAAAGLFLVIVPLIRLGWREWLAERPQLLLHQPGPRLLRRIAARYRVPATDALWDLLPPVDPAGEPLLELERALDLWRAGLGGWLWRKVQLRLADLVLREGWIQPGAETTQVRFPLEAIEIRLRRLALDAHPGWVDWLGHAYRVVYRDRPLIGPDLT